MAERHHVRSTGGPSNVLVVSGLIHKGGRTCQGCGAVWTVRFVDRKPRVQKNGLPIQGVVLDWADNNVAIECCSFALSERD